LSEILTVEFNIEGNPFPPNFSFKKKSLIKRNTKEDKNFPEFMEMVRRVKPTQCTLVPDAPDAFTSNHGWNLSEHGKRLAPIIQELKDSGIRVSLFMDPDTTQIQLAKEVGADRIELYTEPYATAFRNGNPESELQRYARAARAAQEIGLGVNAGHDLNLQNLGKFCSSIPGILEVSIGHALISDALEMGLFNTVKEYLKVLSQT
jgi:pyridoxine 5-phosphate synthase